MGSPSAPESYHHLPVMADETIERLVTDRAGRYLDGTVGGGGHLALLLAKLRSSARVLGLDRDPEAIAAVCHRLREDRRLLLRRAAFDGLEEAARETGMLPLDGVLLDLGVSSHQVDTPGRGFTWRQDAPLDMRMDPEGGETAADLLARLSEQDLAALLKEAGEVRRARALAARISVEQKKAPIQTSGRLRAIVEENTPPPLHTKVLSQVFQALRIEVNDELGQLDRALEAAHAALDEAGRLVVLAYHSLEDRRVKRFLRERSEGCTCPADLPVCVCGAQATMRLHERRAVTASAEEVLTNPRARSARLRWAERIRHEER